MKFQVTIPPLTEDDFQMNVAIEGANWRAALRGALKKIGESADSVKNIACDVQDDGSFKVTDLDNNRIFTVKEVPEAADGAAEAQKKKEEEQRQAEAKRQEEEARRQEEARRKEEERRAEIERQEQTLREEEIRRQEEEFRAEEARAEAKRQKEAKEAKERAEEARRQEESARKEDERKREEKRKDEEQRKREEEKQRAEEQKRQEEKKREEKKKEDNRKLTEETRRKEEVAAQKLAETQKIGRRKLDTIETRAGVRPGADVEFFADAFDSLSELFTINNPQRAKEFILELALRKIPSDAGSVILNDVGKKELTFVVARGPKADKVMGKSLPYGKGIAGYAIAKGVSLAVPDVSHDPRWDPTISEAVSYQTKSILCTPIVYQERCFGALQLLNRTAGGNYTHRELALLNYLAEQLARWLDENGDQ